MENSDRAVWPVGGAGQVRRNIELKARLRSLPQARAVAQRLVGERPRRLRQIDTYFVCRRGRLKLREIEVPETPQPRSAQLIWYERPDKLAPKECRFYLQEVAQPEAMLRTLAAALGVRHVVRKTRDVYWYANVRIHLDEVERLGTFLEFEAVLSPEQEHPNQGPELSRSEAASRQRLERLQREFGIRSEDLLTSSYGDM